MASEAVLEHNHETEDQLWEGGDRPSKRAMAS